MKILLLSQNRVIIEFIKIATRELNAKLYTLKSPNATLECKNFEAVIVDEHFGILSCKEMIPAQITYKKSILLTYDTSNCRGCDVCIKKPFLPTDIVKALQKKKKSILDDDEVESIKNLLAETDDKEQNIQKKVISLKPELFLDIIYSINPKRLRKLLKGAKVTITIEFEKGDKS
jgi:Na+-translocating ferredoxin:NAD+ oxidoreductase RNF subunit RnfB